MLFDRDRHRGPMKAMAIAVAAVFLIGMFVLGWFLLFL
jgi:hypothetical protein